MKKGLMLLLVMIMLNANYVLAEDQSCHETAITQAEMNDCANVDYENAEAELKRTYSLIMKMNQEDTLFLDKLKKSQQAWKKLLDADLYLKYPHKDEHMFYGSVFPMCASMYKTQLTLQRIEFLKEWLVGTEEGDVCSGSLMESSAAEEALKKLPKAGSRPQPKGP